MRTRPRSLRRRRSRQRRRRPRRSEGSPYRAALPGPHEHLWGPRQRDCTHAARALRECNHVAAVPIDAHEGRVALRGTEIPHFFLAAAFFGGFFAFGGSVAAYAWPAANHLFSSRSVEPRVGK